MTQIVIDLTAQEYQRLKRLAEYSQVSVATLLKDAAQHYFPTVLAAIPDVSALSDPDVLRLAHATMDERALERWRALRDASVSRALNESERTELRELQEMFWIGQFAKTEALIEAARRGLLEPPAR